MEKDRGQIGNPLRIVLILSGSLALAIGIIGIAVPVLPTTPLLLLAAACFARSSQRFYNWLISNRILGKYIHDYMEGRGISKRAKVVVIALLWASILLSMVLIGSLPIMILLLVVAIGVTVHVVRLSTPAGPSEQIV